MQRWDKFKQGLDVQTTNSLKFKQLVGVVSQYWNYTGTNCKGYCRYIAYLVARILTCYMHKECLPRRNTTKTSSINYQSPLYFKPSCIHISKIHGDNVILCTLIVGDWMPNTQINGHSSISFAYAYLSTVLKHLYKMIY